MVQYIPIAIMLGLGVLAGLVFTNINRLIGPKHPTEEKLSTYESGMEPVKSARERFSVKFYLVAMLFIVFDIESVFLIPFAVTFDRMGLFSLVEMVLFIATVFVAYAYVWRRGGLEWD